MCHLIPGYVLFDAPQMGEVPHLEQLDELALNNAKRFTLAALPMLA